MYCNNLLKRILSFVFFLKAKLTEGVHKGTQATEVELPTPPTKKKRFRCFPGEGKDKKDKKKKMRFLRIPFFSKKTTTEPNPNN